MKRTYYTAFIIPLLFLILNLVLKGLFLGSNSLGGDEPFSVYHSQQSLSNLFAIFQNENNPPLHFILLHYWIKFFGISELSVRLPSLIFSALTAIFVYKIGLRFFNLRVAIYASILFLFSNYQFTFAHEARAYALMGLLTAVSMYYYMEIIISKNRSNWKLCWFLLANTLLIYTHFFGFFVLFIQFFFILVQRDLLREYYKFLMLFVGVLLLTYSPYLWITLLRFTHSTQGGTWLTPPSGISEFYEMLRVFSNAPVTAVFTIAALVIGLVLLIIKHKQNPNRLATRLIICWFYIPFVFMFVISFWIPMFLDRYLMFISIGFCIVVALSVDFIIQKPKFQYIIPSFICLLFIASVKPNKSNKREVRETVALVKSLENDSTLVLVAPVHFSLNFIYYYDRSLFGKSDAQFVQNELNKRQLYCINSLEGVNYNPWKRIVLVDAASNFSAPNNNILNTLNAEYNQTNKQHIEEIFDVYEFGKR
ncbi:glycosyltransferase family 39 protein [Fluviicola sp.]|uniref:glycosyltransferase family 39 protein n=1 Tax=Fluviicola sp. TaxID=1917219 RepID=UPI003D2C9AF8